MVGRVSCTSSRALGIVRVCVAHSHIHHVSQAADERWLVRRAMRPKGHLMLRQVERCRCPRQSSARRRARYRPKPTSAAAPVAATLASHQPQSLRQLRSPPSTWGRHGRQGSATWCCKSEQQRRRNHNETRTTNKRTRTRTRTAARDLPHSLTLSLSLTHAVTQLLSCSLHTSLNKLLSLLSCNLPSDRVYELFQ